MQRWLSLFGLLIYLASFVTPVRAQDTAVDAPADAETAPIAVVAPEAPPAPAVAPVGNGLSNNNSYTNVDGNRIQSPAYSTNGQVPAGARARCGDGTYSFSAHRQGTCSGHQGVSQWLR
jgi:hypothetical protein